MTTTGSQTEGSQTEAVAGDRIVASGLDEEPRGASERWLKVGWQRWLLLLLCVAYTAFHLLVLNAFPMETWSFRTVHVAGALLIGFLVYAAARVDLTEAPPVAGWVRAVSGLAMVLVGLGALAVLWFVWLKYGGEAPQRPPTWLVQWYGPVLTAGVLLAMIAGWFGRSSGLRFTAADAVLALAGVVVAGYLLTFMAELQFRAGVRPLPSDAWTAVAGVLLILELTRRSAGLALVAICAVFVAYAFFGPYLPGFLRHSGYSFDRFFSYLYTDNGILGPTTAVSSTYIVLFIAFGAFLQVSKVGDYFVNFAFAIAGRARGGPAKVSIFASGFMGMINGTSAGNVVATGSLTIPLMKRVGYRGQYAAAVEAAASTGGQIMPPIMGAGAFIMAEITGIPYLELMAAAVIPAVLYFASVFIMVDFEAQKRGMRGLPGSALPALGQMLRRVYLFVPVILLIATLVMGYSVIRAGTLSLASAVVVSWLSPHRMGPKEVIRALELSSRMAIQLIAVCAAAGVIVGVIGLTGVGLRFSSMLLGLAEHSQVVALIFAMVIVIILGMGMPTTAAYAVAASVIAPGLIQLGIQPLVAHFFVFYFAVVSAITPPVALAAYAGAAIAGSDAMRTSVEAFKLGLAAFIVPFMFFFSPGLLGEGDFPTVARNCATALLGIYFLAAAVQDWLRTRLGLLPRLLALAAAFCLIEGNWMTDLAGITLGALVILQQFIARKPRALA